MTTFTFGGVSLVFSRNPRRPGGDLSFAQPDLRTPAGEKTGRDYLVKNDIVDLPWENMPDADKDGLLSFWLNTARGMANPFDWTDTLGTVRTVRFATPKLPAFRERAFGCWAVSVQLRIES